MVFVERKHPILYNAVYYMLGRTEFAFCDISFRSHHSSKEIADKKCTCNISMQYAA